MDSLKSLIAFFSGKSKIYIKKFKKSKVIELPISSFYLEWIMHGPKHYIFSFFERKTDKAVHLTGFLSKRHTVKKKVSHFSVSSWDVTYQTLSGLELLNYSPPGRV
jgi:hypothetical protein